MCVPSLADISLCLIRSVLVDILSAYAVIRVLHEPLLKVFAVKAHEICLLLSPFLRRRGIKRCCKRLRPCPPFPIQNCVRGLRCPKRLRFQTQPASNLKPQRFKSLRCQLRSLQKCSIGIETMFGCDVSGILQHQVALCCCDFKFDCACAIWAPKCVQRRGAREWVRVCLCVCE